jgi:hypothetical protein
VLGLHIDKNMVKARLFSLAQVFGAGQFDLGKTGFLFYWLSLKFMFESDSRYIERNNSPVPFLNEY